MSNLTSHNIFTSKNILLKLLSFANTIFALIFIIAINFWGSDLYAYEGQFRHIRILLKRYPLQTSVHISQEINVFRNDSLFAVIKKNNEINFTLETSGLEMEIQNKEFHANTFSISASNGNNIQLENKNYRGTIRFAGDGTDILVINEVSIEDYLKGVLPAELGKIDSDSLKESIKAFAITSRTFAINKILENRKFYDVEANVSSQLFFSTESERPFLNKLLDETKSEVLVFDGKIATVFFHSCCGGSTENVDNVFKTLGLPYLIAKKDSSPPNCRFSPVFEWTEAYSTREFLDMLSNYEHKIQPAQQIIDVRVSGKLPSERVTGLDITFSDSTSYTIQAKQIRLVIKRKNNSGILRGLLFSIELKYNEDVLDSVIFHGKGNGHGVGLCQWGSFQLSKEGYSYSEILNFYFPGTKIRKLDDLD